MTKGWLLETILYSHAISFSFISVDYQIGLQEKIVTGDWSQS